MVHAAEQKLNWTEGQASEKSNNIKQPASHGRPENLMNDKNNKCLRMSLFSHYITCVSTVPAVVLPVHIRHIQNIAFN